MRHIFMFILLWTPFLANAQNQRKCYPKCQDFTKEQLLNLDISEQLPHRPDLYKFRVKGTYRGDVYFTEKVPVYVKTPQTTYRFADFIPLGKEIQLDRLTTIQHRMFYRVVLKNDEKGNPVEVWLDGRFIEAFDFKNR